MFKLKKLLGLMSQLLFNEKSETNIGDVLNQTVVEGWNLVKKQNLTPEEEKKIKDISRNLDNIVQLMATCADIEVSNPVLAKRIVSAIPS